MKVSVVIPVYNGHRYLRDAIDSALNQTYANIEVIVVNDGSTDQGRTNAVAQSYGSRIVYIEQENRGVAGALNTGLAAMTGEIFCWLSHDDIYRPTKIEKQVEFFKRLGRDDVILFTNYALIDEEARIIGQVAMEKVIGDKPQLGLLRGCINGCTIFVPRTIFDEVGRFNETLRFTQDYDMWKRMSVRHSIIFMPDVLVNYRTHTDQGSRTAAAIEEGNRLWVSLTDETTVFDRAAIAGSSLRFFQSQAEFLAGTPYSLATLHAWRRAETCNDATKVSVIIPFFNEIGMAKRAALSALSQTHRNLEVIAVNDGSTDDVTELDRVAAADSRLRILHKSNGGPGSARNLGMKASTGEYVAFLDCDDVWQPEKLTLQIRDMQKTGQLLSHTSYNLVYPSRDLGKVIRHTGKLSGDVYPNIIRMCPIHVSTVILHRKLLQEGFRFSETIRNGEDCLLWIEITRQYPILGIPAALTTVEWSDTSAAISIIRSLDGIRNIHAALASSNLHVKHSNELTHLMRAIAHLQKLQQTRRRADNADVNFELLRSTFRPSAFRKLSTAIAITMPQHVFASSRLRFNFKLRSRIKRWAKNVLPRGIVEMLKAIAARDFLVLLRRAPIFRVSPIASVLRRLQDNPKAWIRAAVQASQKGHNLQALGWLEKAAAVHDTARTQVYLGQVWRELKDYERSERHYRAALALDSSEPQGHIGLAILLGARGAHLEAIEHIRRAADFGLDPNYSKIVLASALATAGKTNEADRIFAQRVPIATPPPYKSDSGILRFGDGYSELLKKAQLLSMTKQLVDSIPKGGDAVYFVCCDGVYFERFIEAAIKSCIQISRVDFIFHVHLMNRSPSTDVILLRLRELLPHDRLYITEETVDSSRYSASELRSYYACRRFYLVPDLIRAYDRLLLCADVDQLTIAPVDGLLDKMRDHDVGLTHDPLETLNLPSYFSATAAVFTPNEAAFHFADRVRRYIDYFISIERNPRWHLDQAALAVTYLNDPSSIRLCRFPMSIVHSGALEDNGVSDAIFWSVTSSMPKSAEKLSSSRFLKYAS